MYRSMLLSAHSLSLLPNLASPLTVLASAHCNSVLYSQPPLCRLLHMQSTSLAVFEELRLCMLASCPDLPKMRF